MHLLQGEALLQHLGLILVFLAFPFLVLVLLPFPLSFVVNQKLPSADEDTVELDAASADSASDCTAMLGALGEGGLALVRRELEGSHGTGRT